MQMNDTVRIEAPPETVFAALTDPDTLKASIPGCQEMTGNVEDGFEAVVKQKVGPVSATFRGNVAVHDVDRPRALTLSGEGKGGPAGFAKGGAKVTLTPEDAGTRLAYEVDAKVGGKLAQLGGRVIDGVAKRMAEQFFADFKAAVEGPAAAPTPAQTPDTATMDAAEPTVRADGPPDPTPPAAADSEPGPGPEKKGILGRIFG